MGLTVNYDWKIKTDVPSARRMIAKCRVFALKLPFDDISEIHEQDPPGGKQSGREDLNLRPHGPEPCALAKLSYAPWLFVW